MRAVTSLLLGLALAGCAKVPATNAPVMAVRDGHCAVPEGWADVAARDPDFVVFGEWHGTREAPAFVGSLACGLARQGQRILIAIEFSPEHDAALQRAWTADEDQFESLLLDAGWRGRADGVGSEAMFAMLRDLHRLRLEGHAIAVTAFNGAGGDQQSARFAHLPSQGPHEAAQAENIAQAARAGSYDRVLVLVGELHARKQPVILGNGKFDPMARRLREYGAVLSLDMRYDDGSTWNCQKECKVHPTKGNASFGRERFIALGGDEKDGRESNFDGFYWVGPISASPPKAPDYE